MPSNNAKRAPLASMIDHTLLKPEATRVQIQELCAEAKQHGFATVCVQPFRVAMCADLLRGSKVKVCTVIGFPLGANRAEVKALETVRACADGAEEIDVVMNIGALKDGNLAAVENDMASVIKAAQGRTVKVILETALLTDEEIKSACAVCIIAGADFVKTSTGYGPGGATIHHVKLMKETVGDQVKVKASGGIRDRQTMIAMIEAGASRIGTSNGVAIAHEKGDD
jgi:deoxyribose-phosphate aldolase